ncbi:hypothetical protein [Sphingopyxis sp. JAI108]|uniref:hypothetical protein n=1 Tax=Sphingopyxis sp. JAI108 TaxID=2723060 RepID=UPI0015C97622|nr:hypothetical protein [Sphingopyxis sp. JAI108]NYF32570.1 hypothetical protein [Sphingopyxis sp. JAI108]
MKSWLIMMGGLILWAVHFFLLYLLAEFGGGASGVRVAASLGTLAILGAMAWLGVTVVRVVPQNAFGRWRRRAGLLALAFGGFGIVLQYLPVVLIDR